MKRSVALASLIAFVAFLLLMTQGCASSGGGHSDRYYGGGSIHYNSFPRGYRWAGNAGGYW